jgi:3',5'-cyclic AMP phosphodiesterase CpdA
MKIVHISDLHYGISEQHNKSVERKIRDIASYHPSHLIITGDITNTGREKEYKGIAEILRHYGFYDASKLTVVPGNHDLYMQFFAHFKTPESLYRKFAGIRKYLGLMVNYRLKKYRKDLNHFKSYFLPSFEGVITSKGSLCGFPFIKILDEKTAVIGLDSNQLPGIARNPACSNGVCDMQDYRALDLLLSEHPLKGKCKIAAMHNYLYSYEQVVKMSSKIFARFMATRKVDRYIELFEKHHVNIVLHGHYHFNDEYYVGNNNKIKVLNGGGSRWGKWHEIDTCDSEV